MAKQATLYVVATPIGNLRDITLRALDVLRTADIIAAEDTRVTGSLLSSHGISTRVISTHRHNERESAAGIVKLLAEGKSVALVSDAGTPGVSDPGAVAAAQAMAAGFDVVAVPGPSALCAALSVCGLSAPRICFTGFLPARQAQRRELLASLALEKGLQVFFEAPHRIEESVADMIDAYGAQPRIAIARELTKLYEEVHQCALGEVPAWLRQRPERMRGEFVVVVDSAGAGDEAAEAEANRVLGLLLDALPLKQAVKLAADITGHKRNLLYQTALAIKGAGAAR